MSLDNDVVAAVQAVRAEKGLGLSEAVNELSRSGLAVPRQRTRFVPQSSPMGSRIDVSKCRRRTGDPRGARAPLMLVDAQLAALALEYGLDVYSADSDFARLPR